ncbi:MAG: hypothetical protein ACI87O_000604 [Planctomycetota bacterium]|jgi:hypothetical protein
MPAISLQGTRSQSGTARRVQPRGARILRSLLLAALVAPLAACEGRRVLMVDSSPQGALVRLDEDVIGRTPLEHTFEHYGKRRLSLYLPGYRTYSDKLHLKMPWHASFPIDIFTEILLPLQLGYEKSVLVTLEPDDGKIVYETLDSFVERAEILRDKLALPTTLPEPELDGNPVPVQVPELEPAATTDIEP